MPSQPSNKEHLIKRILCKLSIHKAHKWSIVLPSRLDDYKVCEWCGSIKTNQRFIPKSVIKTSDFYKGERDA